MENIKSLSQSCLTRQPQLNNIPALLIQLLSPQYNPQQRLFISTQLINVLQALHLRGEFNAATREFLQQKSCSFLQLLQQLNAQEQLFSHHIASVIAICEPRYIAQAAADQSELWESVSEPTKAIQVLNQLLKHSSSSKIECLLRLPYPTFEEIDDQGESMMTDPQTQFKKAFQSLLFSVLKDNSLTDQTYRSLVQSFAEKIFPKILSPLNLSEHIFHKYSQTTSLELKVSLMSCLFILIGKYGLEVQDFYTELFNLITLRDSNGLSVFEVANSKKVMKMIESSLRSSKIVFSVLVKFLKLLLNRCLLENTSFVCWVMALCFNLFKKHPLLNSCLDSQSEMYIPEFSIIKNHFLPQIQGLATKLEKNLKKEDFLDIAEFSTIDLQRVLRQNIQTIPDSKIIVPTQIHNLLL